MFCGKCGCSIGSDSAFCPSCGEPLGSNPQAHGGSTLISQLIEKIRLESKVWLGIAALQVIAGLITVVACISSGDSEEIFYGIVLIIVAAVNYKASKDDLKFIEQIKIKPTGIVKKYEPLAEPLIIMAYNLICGGVIGAAGTVFILLTRSFVMDNKQGFLALEQSAQF